MAGSKLRKRLDDLTALIEAKRRADIFIPRSDWPLGLKLWDDFWRHKLSKEHSPYEYLLSNLAHCPPIPLKPQYAHMVSDETGCRQLFELTLGGLKR